MPTAKLTGLVNQLGHGAPDATNPATDAELLARFITSRDEAAFAELVRRHGRLVFGVCRRVTGSHHLAEDAFQAVFVVLATKAATIRPPTAVAAWLHGVACRTALRARTMADRRRRRESAVGTLPEATSTTARDAPDAVALLDEEIARLPDRFRAAVVLCELQGVSRKDAAKRLGLNEGTLSSRLAAARRALADRLRQRGVVLSAAGLSAAFAETASAGPPPALAAKAAATLSPELVSPAVGALSNGVLRIMFLDQLKTVVLLCVVSVGLAVCAALAGPSRSEAEPPRPPKAAPLVLVASSEPVRAKAEPTPLPKGPNKLLFFRSGRLTLIDPDGKNEKTVSEDREKFIPTTDAKLSPDGKMLAVLIHVNLAPPPQPNEHVSRMLFVRGLGEKEPGTSLGVTCETFAWSPDGAEIACSDFVGGLPDKGPPIVESFVVNVKTRRKTKLELPNHHAITDWSRGGKLFLTTAMKADHSRIYLMNRDGTEHKPVTGAKQSAALGRLAPDGKRVLCVMGDVTEETPAEKKARQEAGGRLPEPASRLTVVEIATGKSAAVRDIPLEADVLGYCWSPDGKRIAYTWRKIRAKPEELKDDEWFLVVCDPDGKNQKTIATDKGQAKWVMMSDVDWR